MAKAYVIGDIEVLDPVAYEKYKELAAPTVAAHNGTYLARGGRTDVLEGDRMPHRLVVMEFPGMEEARRWYDSAGYAAARAARNGAARVSLVVVEGA